MVMYQVRLNPENEEPGKWKSRKLKTIWEIAQRRLKAAVGALSKRGCNSTWSTSLETRPAAFERPRSPLSNDAKIISWDVDHVELQPRFVSAPTTVGTCRCEISQILIISMALIFRVRTQLNVNQHIVVKAKIRTSENDALHQWLTSANIYIYFKNISY